jgi:AhpD family alkylhydroperoxidase
MADDVQVENRRLDASENEALIGMARMGADAFGYKADLRIDRQLAQLLRLRVSQLNNCAYCLNLHYGAAREAGIPRAKIDTLTAWWETELHSGAEQAALCYAEALTRAADTDRDAAFQRFHDALAENFSPEEMLEIVGVVVNMNVWTGSTLPRARCRARLRRRAFGAKVVQAGVAQFQQPRGSDVAAEAHTGVRQHLLVVAGVQHQP